jgi:hypothetical protein
MDGRFGFLECGSSMPLWLVGWKRTTSYPKIQSGIELHCSQEGRLSVRASQKRTIFRDRAPF